MKKVIFVLFILLILATLINQWYPFASNDIFDNISITDDQWSNILAALDILVALLLALFAWIETTLGKRKYQYQINIADEAFSFDNYISFDKNNNDSYVYRFDTAMEDISSQFRTIRISLSRRSCAGINIPLIISVLSCPDGNLLKISKLHLFVKQNNKIINQRKVKVTDCTFGPVVKEGMKFFIRLSLRCSFRLEQALLDSRYFICLPLTFHGYRNHTYKKYIIIEIQSVQDYYVIKHIDADDSFVTYVLKKVKILLGN